MISSWLLLQLPWKHAGIDSAAVFNYRIQSWTSGKKVFQGYIYTSNNQSYPPRWSVCLHKWQALAIRAYLCAVTANNLEIEFINHRELFFHKL